MASAVQDFPLRAAQTHIRGHIEGCQHVAAATCGDGACSLHAIFGLPRPADSYLQCPKVRAVVLAGIPEHIEGACEAHGGAVRELCLDVLKAVWTDLALPAARAQLAGTGEAATTAEMHAVWGQLQPEVREELCSFAQAQSYEEASSIARKQQLLAFARQLFVPSKEAVVVRPLCVFLGYLHSAGHDYLHSNPPAETLAHHEGHVGALGLLRACAECPELTKYQALFDMRSMFDRYRLAFFMNGAHNAHRGQQDWMLDALHTVSDGLSAEDTMLLQSGREAVKGRYQCFGTLEIPPSCTWELAWDTFRKALRQGEYWLSVQELQLLAAYHGCRARAFRYERHGAAGGDRFQEEHCPQLSRLAAWSSEVKVVLDVAASQGQARGHFSRLLSSSEWEAHFANIEEGSDADMASSVDLSSPEPHSASDEGSMSSDAEHGSPGEDSTAGEQLEPSGQQDALEGDCMSAGSTQELPPRPQLRISTRPPLVASLQDLALCEETEAAAQRDAPEEDSISAGSAQELPPRPQPRNAARVPLVASLNDLALCEEPEVAAQRDAPEKGCMSAGKGQELLPKPQPRISASVPLVSSLNDLALCEDPEVAAQPDAPEEDSMSAASAQELPPRPQPRTSARVPLVASLNRLAFCEEPGVVARQDVPDEEDMSADSAHEEEIGRAPPHVAGLKRCAAPALVGQEEKLDEELSDISDNSDLFHVAALPSEQTRALEDEKSLSSQG